MPRNTAETTAQVLSRRLAELMEARGWSSYRLADEAGMAESHVANLLNGRTNKPRPETLAKLAAAFAISVAELLDEEPFSTEVVIPLSDSDHDVLYAAASFDRLPLEVLAKQALDLFIEQQAGIPRVQRVLEAMTRGRQEQSTAVVAIPDRSPGPTGG